MEKIKLAVVDDQALFRKGLVAMLQNQGNCDILFEAENGLLLFEKLKQLPHPQMILLDLRMPEMDGIQAMEKLKSEYPKIRVIVISVHDDLDIIAHLIEKGAHAYLDKNADPEEVLLAIEHVHKFDFHFNPAAEKALKEIDQKASKKPKLQIQDRISKRELEVLQLICKEYTNAEIAEQMNLSIRTIEGYREKLLHKSNARNTAGLVLFAVKHQLISFRDLKL